MPITDDDPAGRASATTGAMRIAAVLAFACHTVIAGCDRTSGDVIPERVSDAACRIEMAHVATIGQASGDDILTGRPVFVLRDRSGRYWINILNAFPLIYDPRVGVLREFGRRGGGPGEFRRPDVIAELPGDSLLIADYPAFRIVAWNLTTARSVLSSHRARFAVLHWPDNVIGLSTAYDRATRTSPTLIARYDLSGDTVAVIDTVFHSDRGLGRGMDGNDWRILGRPTADGRIWISDYNSYRLVLYSAAGEPLDSVRRTPRWFPGGGPDRPYGAPDRPASPHTMGSWVDADGRLWTLTAEPRKDTRDAWAEVALGNRGLAEDNIAALPAEYRLKRTLIEVIDPVERRVVSRHTFDGYINAVLPDNDVASFVETDAGVPVLTIHHLALRGCKR